MSKFELPVMIIEGGDSSPIEKTWPERGKTYTAIIDVEHIGPGWIDDPDIKTLDGTDEEVETYLSCCGVGLVDCISEESLPIASGTYKLTLKFYAEGDFSMWSEHDYYEDGFYVLSLEKLS